MNFQLRRGDELVEFFDTFRTMVNQLRERQHQDCNTLRHAIERLETDAGDTAALASLKELRGQMEQRLIVDDETNSVSTGG